MKEMGERRPGLRVFGSFGKMFEHRRAVRKVNSDLSNLSEHAVA